MAGKIFEGLPSLDKTSVKSEIPAGTQKNSAYLFVSFDLRDFTVFKVNSPHLWLDALHRAMDTVAENSFGMTFWKFNGDEFLFYKEISSALEILDIAEDVHDFMRYLEFTTRQVLQTGEHIRMKTGMWLANVTSSDPNRAKSLDATAYNSTLYHRRIGMVYDFAGINMDEGFRMCSATLRSNFVVDPKIAFMFYVLSKILQTYGAARRETLAQYIDVALAAPFLAACDDFLSTDGQEAPAARFVKFAQNFTFIRRTVLKGVWGGRGYPLVVFTKDSEIDGTESLARLKELFEEAGAHKNLYSVVNLLSIIKTTDNLPVRPVDDRYKSPLNL